MGLDGKFLASMMGEESLRELHCWMKILKEEYPLELDVGDSAMYSRWVGRGQESHPDLVTLVWFPLEALIPH